MLCRDSSYLESKRFKKKGDKHTKKEPFFLIVFETTKNIKVLGLKSEFFVRDLEALRKHIYMKHS